ncbi:MAG: hypothetical protein ACJAU6_003953, partial [Alphaproteobacteria bacterium]
MDVEQERRKRNSAARRNLGVMIDTE